jgi:hypothetical protein
MIMSVLGDVPFVYLPDGNAGTEFVCSTEHEDVQSDHLHEIFNIWHENAYADVVDASGCHDEWDVFLR